MLLVDIFRLQSVLTVGLERRQLNIYFCSKWATEGQQYFGEYVDIRDGFQDSGNLVEFLAFPWHRSINVKRAGSTFFAPPGTSNPVSYNMGITESWKIKDKYKN